MELQQLTLLETCLHSAGATAATTTTPGSEASGTGTSSMTTTASGGAGATATASATPSGGRGAGSDILIDLAELWSHAYNRFRPGFGKCQHIEFAAG